MALPVVRLLRSVMVISVCAFSAAMLIAAPYELYRVSQVRQWTRLPARMTEAGYRRADFEPYETYAYFRFVDMTSGRTIETSDVRPGDLPFSIEFMGLKLLDTKRADLSAYPAGRAFVAFRSPDGRHYFLEGGSWGTMSGLLILSLGWWGFVVVRARSRAKVTTPA